MCFKLRNTEAEFRLFNRNFGAQRIYHLVEANDNAIICIDS